MQTGNDIVLKKEFFETMGRQAEINKEGDLFMVWGVGGTKAALSSSPDYELYGSFAFENRLDLSTLNLLD